MDKYNVKFGCRRSWLNLGLFFTAFFLANANAYAFCAGTLIKEIKALANKPEVIEAVKASNARQLGKERIMELDERWIKLKGRLPEADQIINSKVSALLTAAMNKQSYFKEAILTGNQGETVAMNMVTTDYWQGDEEKFTAIFDTNLPSRKPDSHISRARWDDSTKAMIAQVSVPVYDGDYMIGTLTVGVDLKRVPHPNH
ncbi:MAG: hypothetical protein V7542_08400 [Limnobacter sp.]|jgi:hypothetical protein|uniref:hypothetical protein n=1 Tax=unclassified Limnobacter TaxID=2630203 RepID=UPI0011B071B0|nr:hypothetical protein [Limnobacter sp. SAORIC-690]